MPETQPKRESRQRPVESASATPGERRSASPPRNQSRPLREAAASGHPDVHKALGDLDAATRNLAVLPQGPVTRDPEAEAARDDALSRLKELGYE